MAPTIRYYTNGDDAIERALEYGEAHIAYHPLAAEELERLAAAYRFEGKQVRLEGYRGGKKWTVQMHLETFR